MRFRPSRPLTALAGCALLLGACGNPPEEASFGCPRVGLLDNQSKAPVTASEDGRRLATAQLVAYDGYCRYDGDSAIVQIDVTLDVTGRDENAQGSAEVPYYVAVQDAAGDLVAKRELSQSVTVPESGQTRSASAALRPEFDLGETPPAAYTILIGLMGGESSRPVADETD